jgi:phosphate transport system substrate-binding protein
MKSKNIKKFAFIALLLSLVGFAFSPAPERITVKGSDTMVILAQKWAEAILLLPFR